MNKVIVIGAGPAGLIAGWVAAKNGLDVTIIEKNDRPARKLMITGKGRCNVTNNADVSECVKNTPTNGRFLYSAFSNFSPRDIMDLLEKCGVPLKIERGNRVFPVSDKAVSIVDALVNNAKQSGCKIIKGRAVDIVIKNNYIESVLLEDGEKIDCDAVVLATGGISYPLTGSTGDGYELAKKAGHTITPLKPSLVGLEIHEGFICKLEGLSLRNIAVKICDTKTDKIIYSDFGEMLFTGTGISGPVILSASAHINKMEKGRYKITIDLKPALCEKTLETRVLKDFLENQNKDYINSLSGLLPNKLIPVFAKRTGIPPNIKVNQITKEQRQKIISILKCFDLTITSFRPIEEAVITSGGVCVKEIEPKTMKSKLIDNLYFAGEIIDADAYTGGFNLQIAYSTGYAAGNNIKLKQRKEKRETNISRMAQK